MANLYLNQLLGPGKNHTYNPDVTFELLGSEKLPPYQHILGSTTPNLQFFLTLEAFTQERKEKVGSLLPCLSSKDIYPMHHAEMIETNCASIRVLIQAVDALKHHLPQIHPGVVAKSVSLLSFSLIESYDLPADCPADDFDIIPHLQSISDIMRFTFETLCSDLSVENTLAAGRVLDQCRAKLLMNARYTYGRGIASLRGVPKEGELRYKLSSFYKHLFGEEAPIALESPEPHARAMEIGEKKVPDVFVTEIEDDDDVSTSTAPSLASPIPTDNEDRAACAEVSTDLQQALEQCILMRQKALVASLIKPHPRSQQNEDPHYQTGSAPKRRKTDKKGSFIPIY